jgi:hypothetical protein
MNLQEIDVGCFKTGKRGIDSIEDRLTGETTLVDVFLEGSEVGLEIALLPRMVTDEAETFGENEYLVAWDVVLGQKISVNANGRSDGRSTLSMNFAISSSENPFE